LTLEMVTAEERDWMWEQYAPEPVMKLNLGIRRRLAPLMDNDRAKIELLNSLLFTLPGAPVLYYGDEIGMGDNIALFDRNGVRTPLQWTDETNAGFSSAESLYAPVIDDATFGYQKLNIKAQQADPNSLLHTVRQMIAARKSLPVLAEGKLEWLPNQPRTTLCFWRRSEAGRVLALHNLSDQPVTIPLPSGTLTDALHSGSTVSDQVTLAAHEYRWLK